MKQYIEQQTAGLFESDWQLLLKKCGSSEEELSTTSCDSAFLPIAHARWEFSAKTLWALLGCLLESDGRREEAFKKFLSLFAPAIKRELEQVSVLTPFQKFARLLAVGEYQAALELAGQNMLWSHALIVSRLVSAEAYSFTVNYMTKCMTDPAITINAAGSQQSSQLSPTELSDPFVAALLRAYELLGQAKPVTQLVEESRGGSLRGNWIYSTLMTYSLLAANSVGGMNSGGGAAGQKGGAAAGASPGGGTAGGVKAGTGGGAGGTTPAGGGQFQIPQYADRFLFALGNALNVDADPFAAHVNLLLCGHSLESVDHPNSHLALLGVEHKSTANFRLMLEPFSLQMSEVFEYAQRLGNQQALCMSIQPFKMGYAYNLTELNQSATAQRYLELLADFRKAVPSSKYSDAFRVRSRELGEKLAGGQKTGGYSSGGGDMWGGGDTGGESKTGQAVKGLFSSAKGLFEKAVKKQPVGVGVAPVAGAPAVVNTTPGAPGAFGAGPPKMPQHPASTSSPFGAAGPTAASRNPAPVVQQKQSLGPPPVSLGPQATHQPPLSHHGGHQPGGYGQTGHQPVASNGHYGQQQPIHNIDPNYYGGQQQPPTPQSGYGGGQHHGGQHQQPPAPQPGGYHPQAGGGYGAPPQPGYGGGPTQPMGGPTGPAYGAPMVPPQHGGGGYGPPGGGGGFNDMFGGAPAGERGGGFNGMGGGMGDFRGGGGMQRREELPEIEDPLFNGAKALWSGLTGAVGFC